MHHAPDETSRPPHRRPLGRGGSLRGAETGATGTPGASTTTDREMSGPATGAPKAAVPAPVADRELPGPAAGAPEADVRPSVASQGLPGAAALAEAGAREGRRPAAAGEAGPVEAEALGGLYVAGTDVADAAPPAGGPGPVGGDAGGDPDRVEAAGGRFTVRLANFEGPFDLLLQLITKHKLDVTEVALSEVTDEFMAHLRALGPDGDLDQTTEFLVVAATLLDLKTARLLPAAEVEDEADLALLEARDLLFARLLQYRAYKRIAAILEERWEDEGRRHPRTVGLEPHHAALLPEVVLSVGAEGLARLAVKAMQPKAEPQVYVEHIHAPLVSVREQAAVVAALLRERGTAAFRELIEDADDTLTVVARFLALLELYRERAVALDQETALGDLTVSWTGGDGETRVTDEFDQEPGQEQETEARA
ncbi:segregation and condensation protein A [Streptomyces sp. NPDC090093]|uniref:segregation and condensation protein A n=1 Tax=Streptomyces sp. NPDC090093 TaxID=3365945 RepID=UPI003806F8FB